MEEKDLDLVSVEGSFIFEASIPNQAHTNPKNLTSHRFRSISITDSNQRSSIQTSEVENDLNMQSLFEIDQEVDDHVPELPVPSSIEQSIRYSRRGTSDSLRFQQPRRKSSVSFRLGNKGNLVADVLNDPEVISPLESLKKIVTCIMHELRVYSFSVAFTSSVLLLVLFPLYMVENDGDYKGKIQSYYECLTTLCGVFLPHSCIWIAVYFVFGARIVNLWVPVHSTPFMMMCALMNAAAIYWDSMLILLISNAWFVLHFILLLQWIKTTPPRTHTLNRERIRFQLCRDGTATIFQKSLLAYLIVINLSEGLLRHRKSQAGDMFGAIVRIFIFDLSFRFIEHIQNEMLYKRSFVMMHIRLSLAIPIKVMYQIYALRFAMSSGRGQVGFIGIMLFSALMEVIFRVSYRWRYIAMVRFFRYLAFNYGILIPVSSVRGLSTQRQSSVEGTFYSVKDSDGISSIQLSQKRRYSRTVLGQFSFHCHILTSTNASLFFAIVRSYSYRPMDDIFLSPYGVLLLAFIQVLVHSLTRVISLYVEINYFGFPYPTRPQVSRLNILFDSWAVLNAVFICAGDGLVR